MIPTSCHNTLRPADVLQLYKTYFIDLLMRETTDLTRMVVIKTWCNPSVKWYKAVPDEDTMYKIMHFPVHARTITNEPDAWSELFTDWGEKIEKNIERENSLGSGYTCLGTTELTFYIAVAERATTLGKYVTYTGYGKSEIFNPIGDDNCVPKCLAAFMYLTKNPHLKYKNNTNVENMLQAITLGDLLPIGLNYNKTL